MQRLHVKRVGGPLGTVLYDRCPRHTAIGSLLQCQRCMGMFWSQQNKLKRMEMEGA